MRNCIVWSCGNKGKIPGVSYHQLSKSRYDSWLKAIGRNPNDKLSPLNVVCSIHFDEMDLIEKGGSIKLRRGAIPKLFLPRTVFQTALKEIGNTVDSCIPSTSHIEDISDPIQVEVSQKMHFSSHSSSDSAGLTGVQKKNRKLIKTIHTYATTPDSYKTKFMNERKKTRTLQYRSQLEREKTKRLRKKVVHLQHVVSEIRKKNMISPNACNVLENTYSGIPLALMKRLLYNSRRGKITRSKYDERLRSFAMTLNFYSTKAYEYVRKTFNLALPSQRTIRGWYSNISCEPGFSDAAFQSLKAKVQENKNKGLITLCSLMFDEMHIKKHVEFYNGKNWGYVNLGTNIHDNDGMLYAKEAFVVMVVAVNASWKLPIAYFFIDGLNGQERANVVREALTKLYECGVKITSVSCDGPNVNFTMFNQLGAEVNKVDSLKPYFLHPVDGSKIFVVFDACHMVKLIRNNWASQRIFIDMDGEIVDFRYVEMLHTIQENEGLRLGNKFKTAHMEWRKQKMKVNLAVETLSESVASAIEFLMIDMKDYRFKEAKATIEFIRLIDKLFDISNSRNPLNIRMKMPLSEQKELVWKPFLDRAVSYLLNLKLMNNIKLIHSNQKTGFKGFILTSLSLINLYEIYVKGEKNILKYFLTYKLSTDHLELFFCSMRSRNGWNNNPSTVQFYHSYRRLLLHHDIKNMTGNCISQDETNILYVTGTKRTPVLVDQRDSTITRKYRLDDTGFEDVFHDHDYSLPINISLSDVSENVVGYVAGYAVIMAAKLVKCPVCTDALSVSSESQREDNRLKLLFRKKRGNLTIPSSSSIIVCTAAEKKIKRTLLLNNNKIPSESNFFPTFINALHTELILKPNLFPNISVHNLTTLTLDENHMSKIIKSLCVSYYKIRMYNLAKSESYRIKGNIIRKTLNKTILFKNQ